MSYLGHGILYFCDRSRINIKFSSPAIKLNIDSNAILGIYNHYNSTLDGNVFNLLADSPDPDYFSTRERPTMRRNIARLKSQNPTGTLKPTPHVRMRANDVGSGREQYLGEAD